MKFFVAIDARGRWPAGVVDFVVAKHESDAVRQLNARCRHFKVDPPRPFQLRELNEEQVQAHLGIGRRYVRDVRTGVV